MQLIYIINLEGLASCNKFKLDKLKDNKNIQETIRKFYDQYGFQKADVALEQLENAKERREKSYKPKT